MTARIAVDRDRTAEFCQRWKIVSSPPSGAVPRADFRPGSDVDVLVEFEPSHGPGSIGLLQSEEELSALLGGRNLDLRQCAALQSIDSKARAASEQPGPIDESEGLRLVHECNWHGPSRA